MIEIQLTTALLFYGILIGLMGVAIWIYTELSVNRPQQRLGQQFLWRCTFCGCTYLDETAETVSECPRCESLNTLTDKGAPPNLAKFTPKTPTEAHHSEGGGSKRKRRGGKRGPRRRR
jgi:hypothetical protein